MYVLRQRRPPCRSVGGTLMAMDFETVKFMRFLFALVGAAIGAAAGIKYYEVAGAVAGGVIGAIIGWNTVDLFKGRARK